jgi:hypothetical protein
LYWAAIPKKDHCSFYVSSEQSVEHEWGKIYTREVPAGKFKERVIWEDLSIVERINVQLHLRGGDVMKLTFLIFL